MSIGESTQDVMDMENKQLELNEKEMEQMADFARDIIIKSGFYVNKINKTELCIGNKDYDCIHAHSDEIVIDNDGFNTTINLGIDIIKDYNNKYGLLVYTENSADSTGWLLIGKNEGIYENPEDYPVEISELKLNDKFYEQIKKDYEAYKSAVIQGSDEPLIISHDINQFIDQKQELNPEYKIEYDPNPSLPGMNWKILKYSDREGYEGYYIDSEHISKEMADKHLSKLQENTNEKQITSNPKELEKMARVQGVCEAMFAINDFDTRWYSPDIDYLCKKMLTEMKITQEDCKKYAKPETYKELEKTIFKPKQEQNLEQTQSVRR